MTLAEIQARLEAAGNADIAAHSAGFFCTGPGEYGEGDRFRGIRVPVLRKLARTCDAADMSVVEQLLMSPWHEDRLCALFVLIRRYERGDNAQKEAVFALYLKRVEYVNNWDLVDASAPKIVGAHLESGEKRLLFDWVRDESLWKRRIAVIATYWYIKRGQFDAFLAMAEQLLGDDQDLDAQGRRVDAARSGEEGPCSGGSLSAPALPEHAPDHAALRHRTIRRENAITWRGGFDYLEGKRIE